MANYICQNRHGMFYFRFIIPVQYRNHFKHKREIRFSLKTDSKKVAVLRARLYRVRFDRVLEKLQKVTDKDDEILTTHYFEATSLFGGPLKAKKKGLTLPEEREEVMQARRDELELIKAAKEAGISIEDLRVLQGQSDEDRRAVQTSSDETWEQYSDKYLSELINSKKVKEDTAVEYRTSYVLLSDFAGAEHKMAEFDADLLTDFYRSLSDRAISTQNKHLTRISSVFKWAVTRRVIPFNPIDGVMTLNDEERKQDKREMFDTDDLKKVFESDYYLNNKWRKRLFKVRTPYTFWMFPLALFTGARMSELLLLETANVFIDDETPYIDLRNEVDPETGKETKKLKNKNSIRKIPISEVLIEMGFAKFVKESRGKYLFPDIIRKETTTDAGQKVLGSRLDKTFKVWVANTKSFHSFRHTFVNAAALSGANFKYLSAVTGHLSKKEIEEQKLYKELSATYVKDYPVDVLKREVIDKLKFDVDFGGVRWPK